MDNALDARRGRGPVHVEITYNIREGWLRVEDDGAGMSRKELSDALVLALSNKGATDIGKFGLGMKTACSSLGTQFTIKTAQADGHYAWIADYDEEQFLMTGEWKLPVRRRKKQRPHGTTIVIQSSRLYGSLQQSLVRNLGWTFRHFLLDGLLELSINGESVKPAHENVDPESVMPFDGVVAGKRVWGWAGLLHKSSQRGWYGFALIRHRRIVRRHEKIGFQPHPSTARVVGELHLDAFDTNNLKTDFIRETQAWRELEEWVSGTSEPVLAQSRALAHAGMLDLKIRARIDEERRRLVGDRNSSKLFNLPSGFAGRYGEELSPPVAVAVGPLHMEHVFFRGDPDQPYSLVESHKRPDEADLLIVKTNLEHAACGQISDRSGWACHNVAEAAAQELATPKDVLALKSIILTKLLSERGLRRALAESARTLLRPASSEAASGVVA